jgi:hypothetical protein
MIQANCLHCERPFRPRRSTARFCSNRCRLNSHRSVAARTPLTATETPPGAIVSVSGAVGLQKQSPAISETLSGGRPLPRGIVPDAKWSGMYRLRLPDGELSDMVNLTRAKDALVWATPFQGRVASCNEMAAV